MNQARYQRVLDQITNHPETWDQTDWHSPCETKHCVAGWAQIMSGQPASIARARADANLWLDLTHKETEWLFDAERTMAELVDFTGFE